MSEKYIFRHLNNSVDCETVDQNYHKLESDLAKAREERDRYREALEKAQEIIHGEFCGMNHHQFCSAILQALAGEE